jgi:long-chain acyl-CoA synthetase
MERRWIKQYPRTVAPDISFGTFSSISDCLERAVAKYSRQPAATCMGTTLSFAELQNTITRFASFLQNSLHIGKGDRVAIMLPNTLQFLIAELAVLKCGGICVNTNPLYTPREMLHQLSDSGAKAIVILDMFADKLAGILKDTKIEHVVITSIADQLPTWKRVPLRLFMKFKNMVPHYPFQSWSFNAAIRKANPEDFSSAKINLDDLAVLQYTGGTTGVAKGAILTHKNILANMLQIQEVTKQALTPGGETVLTALPLYHIFALSVNFLAFLADGHHIILVPKPIPIQNTVDMFRRYQISVMTGVNTLFNALNNSRSFRELAPKSLRVVVAGGMALQDHVNKTFQSITGVPITEGFGLTEASPVTHVNPISTSNPVGSIGIPLPSTLAKIVDENGIERLPGEIGELVVQGPQVMRGYWNRDDETAKVLRDGWLYTGDLGRMDDRGFFFIVDRKKDMIIVSGFNVYPNEIEGVLAQHPKVLEAAVIGVPDKNSGESVKAFVVARDKTLTVEELRSYCKENLTGYKCPRSFEFCEQLPKSNIGKILRRELRQAPPNA